VRDSRRAQLSRRTCVPPHAVERLSIATARPSRVRARVAPASCASSVSWILPRRPA
jgi:hypothetical protein